jgi:signal transduction histidine kinase
MMRPRSLSARLIVSSALVSIVLMAVVGVILAGLFNAALERNFDARLRAVLDGLLANVEVDADGKPQLPSQLVDTRFDLPLSGWYWQIVPVVPGQGDDDLASESLLEQRLHPQPELLRNRGTDGVASFYMTDSNGVSIRAIEQVFKLPGSNREFSVLVAGNFDELGDEVTAFRQALVASLVLLALGLLLVTVVQVRFGLRPLNVMQRNLADIRQGRAEQLKGDYPAEIQPVAEELNLLLQSNVEIVERARTQVGNLAHALKTPLSVLTNEAAGQNTPLAHKVAEQVELMRNQVNLYLDRARRAARAQGIGAVTEVKPVLEALARTLQRINRDKGVTVTVECEDALKFRGEKQDFEEMVGNLLDNACKWASGQVIVRASIMREATTAGRVWLVVEVDDDGPGLAADKHAEALKRGRRLDESKPGSGLGLSIVSETAGMYSGTVKLGAADIGGLRVKLRLPAAM